MAGLPNKDELPQTHSEGDEGEPLRLRVESVAEFVEMLESDRPMPEEFERIAARHAEMLDSDA